MKNDFIIYVIEDDPDIQEIIVDNLKREGYYIKSYTDGVKGYDAVVEKNPDLVVLDLNLPGMSGIEVCKYIRGNEVTAEIPIIMLTARSEEIDKIIGFEVGADDYVTKPFSPRELLARIKVHLKRSKKANFELFSQKDLTVNFSSHQVTVKKKAVELTPIQFKLLKTLIEANGKALSRQFLLDKVWGEEYYGDPRTVDVHITRLREKIDRESKLIKTVKGTGYRWKTKDE